MPKCMNCQFSAHVKKYKRCSDSSLYKTTKNQVEIFEIGFYAKKFVLPIWARAFKFIFGRFTVPTDRIQLGLHDMAITTFLFFCQKSWEHTDNQKGNVFFLVEEEAGGDAMLVSAYQNVCLNKINRVSLQVEKCHRKTNDIASFNPGNYLMFLWTWLIVWKKFSSLQNLKIK